MNAQATRRLLWTFAAMVGFAWATGSPAALAAPAEREKASFFESKIRPVLAGTCMECHGAQKAKNGLRVGGRVSLLEGGENGPAIVPGKPGESLLMEVIRREHPDIQMPPDDPLGERTVAAFEQWIRDGAYWPSGGKLAADQGDSEEAEEYWAFEPIRRPDVPEVSGGVEAENPIDAFIYAKLEEKGLTPAPPADKRALIRRATYDLTGLPPTPEQVRAFLEDDSPDAFAEVVDRLLASPEYGRRWGRHWLDVARYADTAGAASDMPVPEMYRYRDYVIEAYNEDLPYDRFLIEQLAGDILAKKNPDERYTEKIVATTYIGLSRRFGNSKFSDPELIIENTLSTIGRGMLGMTIACARCHDHKFDPISDEDYYGLYGYFKSTQYPFAGTEHDHNRSDFVPIVPPEEREGMEDVPVAYAVTDKEKDEVGDARVQKAGNRHNKGKRVDRGFLSVITPADADIPEGSSGRLQLARWIASPDNPLTARVMVNRIWQHHFGKGIVATVDNFGVQGQPPTHPKLLDWLASEFIERGWSIKAMHRLIMLSDAYRRSSETHAQGLAADPTNKWYWRQDRRRIEVEAIRDAILAVGGRLDLSPVGPHPFPNEKERRRFNQHNPFAAVYEHNHRSVYLMTQRLQKHPILGLFNSPNRNQITGNRDISVVPLQALFMMNSDFVHENARAFAERLMDSASDPAQRIRRGYMLAYARPPTDEEMRRMLGYIQRYESDLAKAEPALETETRRLRAWASFTHMLISSNEFIYID